MHISTPCVWFWGIMHILKIFTWLFCSPGLRAVRVNTAINVPWSSLCEHYLSSKISILIIQPFYKISVAWSHISLGFRNQIISDVYARHFTHFVSGYTKMRTAMSNRLHWTKHNILMHSTFSEVCSLPGDFCFKTLNCKTNKSIWQVAILFRCHKILFWMVTMGLNSVNHTQH
jgi:hypothetical protein